MQAGCGRKRLKKKGMVINMNWMFRLQKKAPWLTYGIIALLAIGDAFFSVYLVYPNPFAPAGAHGIVTMIQERVHFSTGYSFLIVNLPMLAISFFVINKRYCFKNLLYVVLFSGGVLAIQNVLSANGIVWGYVASGPEGRIVLAMLVGAFNGLIYAVTVSLGGSTGGTDILGALINRARPLFDTVWIIFTINVGVAVASYFVYGRELMPVICSVVCSFAGGFVGDTLLKGANATLKFEIITSEPEALAKELMEVSQHGCTRTPAVGMYEQKEKSVLLCVVNARQRIEVEEILAKYPGTFAYCSPVSHTYGYFERIK